MPPSGVTPGGSAPESSLTAPNGVVACEPQAAIASTGNSAIRTPRRKYLRKMSRPPAATLAAQWEPLYPRDPRTLAESREETRARRLRASARRCSDALSGDPVDGSAVELVPRRSGTACTGIFNPGCFWHHGELFHG